MGGGGFIFYELNITIELFIVIVLFLFPFFEGTCCVCSSVRMWLLVACLVLLSLMLCWGRTHYRYSVCERVFGEEAKKLASVSFSHVALYAVSLSICKFLPVFYWFTGRIW